MENQFWTLSAARQAIPLKRIGVKGVIEDLAASIHIEQTFRNTTSDVLEAVYTFPLEWSSVVTEFAAVIGDERLVAKSMPKAEAAKKYEKALDEGDLPVMLESNSEGIATATLGNLKPGEEVTIEITLFTLLAPQSGTVRLTLPFTFGERYSPDGSQGKLEPYERVESSFAAEYPVSVDFIVRGLLAKTEVSAPSHLSSIVRGTDGSLEIAFHRVFADRHVVLLFDKVPDVNALYWAKDPFEKDNLAGCLVITPPAAKTQSALLADLLIDCSGSMSGVGIEMVRESLAALTEVLGGNDRVTLTRFGSETEPVIRSPRIFDKAFVRRSFLKAVESIDADLGGTELEAAVKFVSERDEPVCPYEKRVIVLISDGEIWDIDNLISEAKKRGLPIFCVGVGDCAAEGNLQALSIATGGICEVVTHAENMAPVLSQMLSAARFEKVRVKKEESLEELTGSAIWAPPISKAAYAGCAQKYFLRFNNLPKAPLTVSFGEGNLVELTLNACGCAKELAQAAAGAQCVSSRDAGDLASQYGLLTLSSSLLLVKERAEAEKAFNTRTVNVPHMPDLNLQDEAPQGPFNFLVCNGGEHILRAPTRCIEKKAVTLKTVGRHIKEISDPVCQAAVNAWIAEISAGPSTGIPWSVAVSLLPEPLLSNLIGDVQKEFPALSAENAKELVPVLILATVLFYCCHSEDFGDGVTMSSSVKKLDHQVKMGFKRITGTDLAEETADKFTGLWWVRDDRLVNWEEVG